MSLIDKTLLQDIKKEKLKAKTKETKLEQEKSTIAQDFAVIEDGFISQEVQSKRISAALREESKHEVFHQSKQDLLEVIKTEADEFRSAIRDDGKESLRELINSGKEEAQKTLQIASFEQEKIAERTKAQIVVSFLTKVIKARMDDSSYFGKQSYGHLLSSNLKKSDEFMTMHDSFKKSANQMDETRRSINKLI